MPSPAQVPMRRRGAPPRPNETEKKPPLPGHDECGARDRNSKCGAGDRNSNRKRQHMKSQLKDLCKKSAAASLLALLLFGPAAMGAKSKSGDSADVVAHITLAGNDSVVIAEREVGRKHYLFINQPSQRAVAVVDITNAKKPVIVKAVTYPDGAQSTGEIFGTNLLLVKAEKAKGPGEHAPSGVVAFGGPLEADTPQQFTGLTSF